MKRIITIVSLLVLAASVAKAAVFSGNLSPGTSLITTNRASVYAIELTTGVSSGALVSFFDNDKTNAPYYGSNTVNSAWYTRVGYTTNQATSFVGYNGYTNWYTNSVMYFYFNTNAANTNVQSPTASFVVAGGTYANYTVDCLFSQGISVNANTNVSYVIYYKSAQ